MPQYKYKAQDEFGKKTRGVMNANDETELQARLREKGLFCLSAEEAGSSIGFKSEFKPLVLSDFCRQLATLTAAGVSLVKALNIISKGESVKPKEKAVYEDLLRQLRQGIALSEAMEAQGGVFPPLMIYMFRSAESSGNLDGVAMKLAVMYEKEHRMNGKISSSLTYPKILGVMIIGVILIMTNFVLPKMDELISQMEQLPATTEVLLGVSDFMTNYWYLVIAMGIGAWIGIRFALTIPSVRLVWHRVKLYLPILGKLQRVICTARFARTLSSLYAAGIPIVSAVQIARKTTGNDYIDAQFDEVIPYIRAGNNLSEGLHKVDGMVRKLSDSIVVGEETGSLDTMLLSTSESLEYDSDIAITKMVSYIEPCMLIIMGAIVAFVLVAVFSALYGSYGAVAAM